MESTEGCTIHITETLPIYPENLNHNTVFFCSATVKPLVDTTLVDWNALPEQDSHYTNFYCFVWQNK